VLFLDDLQWANKESIDLLAAVLTDVSIEGFMVVGACRGNEVAIHDGLSIMLRRLEDTYELCVY
jgi:histidine kinase